MKHLKRQTKVIATIGPASEDEATLTALLEEGVDVCRLNMAHAGHDWVRSITRRIREVGKRVGREPAIMMDVKGPEIRTGFRKGKIQLEDGQQVDLVHKLQDPPTIASRSKSTTANSMSTWNRGASYCWTTA